MVHWAKSDPTDVPLHRIQPLPGSSVSSCSHSNQHWRRPAHVCGFLTLIRTLDCLKYCSWMLYIWIYWTCQVSEHNQTWGGKLGISKVSSLFKAKTDFKSVSNVFPASRATGSGWIFRFSFHREKISPCKRFLISKRFLCWKCRCWLSWRRKTWIFHHNHLPGLFLMRRWWSQFHRGTTGYCFSIYKFIPGNCKTLPR